MTQTRWPPRTMTRIRYTIPVLTVLRVRVFAKASHRSDDEALAYLVDLGANQVHVPTDPNDLCAFLHETPPKERPT